MRPRWLALGVIVALACAAGAWWLGEQVGSPSAGVHAATHGGRPASDVAFADPAGGFTLSYPRTWQQLAPRSPDITLIAVGPDGASFEVRKTQVGATINASNLGAARKLTDRVVGAGRHVVALHAPQQVTLGGLPGYLYLYAFDDPTSGERDAHAHYFLFQGSTMITLVFQAAPASRILSLAPLFDRVAASFRAAPG